jgi:hypothetical protein
MRSLILGAALLFCASAIAQPLPVAAPEQADHLGLNIKNQVAAPGDIRKYYREQVDALVYGAMTELRKPK